MISRLDTPISAIAEYPLDSFLPKTLRKLTLGYALCISIAHGRDRKKIRRALPQVYEIVDSGRLPNPKIIVLDIPLVKESQLSKVIGQTLREMCATQGIQLKSN